MIVHNTDIIIKPLAFNIDHHLATKDFTGKLLAIRGV